MSDSRDGRDNEQSTTHRTVTDNACRIGLTDLTFPYYSLGLSVYLLVGRFIGAICRKVVRI